MINRVHFIINGQNQTAFEYINQTMRSIRKVQNDCHLLKFCIENEKNQKKNI